VAQKTRAKERSEAVKGASAKAVDLGAGLWGYPLVALAISLVGVAIAAGLIYLQLLGPANTVHAERLHQSHAQMFATYFDARLLALRTSIDRVATAPQTAAVLQTFDPQRIKEHGERLTHQIADAERIELVPLGEAKVDLTGVTPISFAALDVIRRAETAPYVGPEAYLLDQRSVFYVARPVMGERGVIGVLFAAISMDYFYHPMAAFDASLGTVSIEQHFEGTEPRNVLSYGEMGSRAKRIKLNIDTPRWSLIFMPNPAVASPVVEITDLAAPFGLLIATLLGAIYLTNVRLFSAITADASTLLDYVTRLVRGRGGNIDRYRLGLFQRIAVEANKYAKQASDHGAEEPRVARRSSKQRAQARVEAAAAAKAAHDDADSDGAQDELDDQQDEFLDVAKSNVHDDNFGIEVSEEASPVDMGLHIDPHVFRAYDIRGIVGESLTEDLVYWIGRAFGAEAAGKDQSKVTIAGDGRISTAALKASLARGLTESGVDVIDIGVVPTPLLYFANFALNTGTGIMVTGSHNPPEYNGLKMVLAGETLAEGRIQQLRERIEQNDFTSGEGVIDEADIIDSYLDRVVEDVAVAQPLKVVVDCGNGVAGVVAPRLITELGCEVVPLYCEIDGTFPNHHPDPADPANLEDLITVVKDEGADLGLAFDGDGDRIGVVTASGEIIWPDKLMMLFSRDIVGRNPGADIIFDVKCSRHLNSVISEYGGRPIMWKTGHSHIKAKLKETGALLGGEFSGHICFGERWYGFDDAIYSAARLLEIIGGEAQDAEELFAEFPVTFSTPEIKIETTEVAKFDIVEQFGAVTDFGAGTVTRIDGIRVDFPDGWGLVRASNTSPVLTLRFEADGQEALQRIQQQFKDGLQAINGDLEVPF
jgi:phosphomannomutase/phosphoglucomutase